MSSLFRHSNYFGQNNFNWALSLQKYLLNQKADYGFVYAVLAEWLNARVLKTREGNSSLGSNPRHRASFKICVSIGRA